MKEKNELDKKDLAKPRAHYSKRERQLGVIPQDGYMRLEQVLSVLPMSKSALYAGIRTGHYPKQINKLGVSP
ncbi:MAG: AlpA family phage regulatory protein [Mariprofundaceae bacterium]